METAIAIEIHSPQCPNPHPEEFSHTLFQGYKQLHCRLDELFHRLWKCLPTPNRWFMVQYSTLVPSLHNVIASCLSAGIGLCKKSTLSKAARSWLCKYMKVTWLTRKFCLNKASCQQVIMSVKNAMLLR